LPNQTISHDLIAHLRILQDELEGLNTAGAYYLTTSLIGLQDYVPPPELFYSDILKEVYDSPIFLESLPIFTLPDIGILAEISNYAERAYLQYLKYFSRSQPLAICLPSVGGKSTLARRLARFTQDIDTLPNHQERQYMELLVNQALEDNIWHPVNTFWQRLIKLKANKSKILLAHHPDQLPTDYLYYIVNVPLQPYIDKVTDPTRRRIAPLNRQSLEAFSNHENYRFFTRPHLVYKFVQQLIINPDFSLQVVKPKKWYYAIRLLQCDWLLGHLHPLHFDERRLRTYLLVSYEDYTSATKYSEGFKDQPIMAYFTPNHIYKAFRNRPSPFDITLGPYSDGFMMYRKWAAPVVHFYKFFLRNFGYTVGFTTTMFKNISSIFKKHNHWISPAWRLYVDIHMLAPPLPDPQDASEFMEQLDGWFTRQYYHSDNNNVGLFKEKYSKTAVLHTSQYSVTPNPKISSLAQHLYDNISSLGTSGAAPLLIKKVFTPHGDHRLRRNKATLLTQVSPEFVTSAPYYSGPYTADAAIKHETGFRNRLIIAAPTMIYLRDSAIVEPLERQVSSKRTTLFFDANQLLLFKRSRSNYTEEYFSNPTDMKSCESQQNTFILQTTINLVHRLAKQAFPHATDLDRIATAMLRTYSSPALIKYKDNYIIGTQGNPSGIRMTQWFNTIYNNIQQDYVNNFLSEIAFQKSIANVGTGDDADSFNKSLISIILSKMKYNNCNFRIAIKNDWIGVLVSEFLRYVHYSTGYYGYPARILRAINFANPYHNETQLEPNEELQSRISTYLTYASRLQLNFPFVDLYYDLRQFFINTNIHSFTIDEIFSLVHTPRSMFGFGVLPFFPQHDKFTYRLPPRLSYYMSRPPPINIELPKHYTQFFDKIFKDTGITYRPTQSFISNFLLDFRPRLLKTKLSSNSIRDFQLLNFVSEEELLTVATTYYKTNVLVPPNKDLYLRSPYADSPFWADIFKFFSRQRMTVLLFPNSELFHMYKSKFRPRDFNSIMQFGIKYTTVSHPFSSDSFFNGLSQNLTHMIIEKYLTEPILPIDNFLRRLDFTIEHFIHLHHFELYNLFPYYHGS